MPRATKPAEADVQTTPQPAAAAMPPADVAVSQQVALHEAVERIGFAAADGVKITPQDFITVATLVPDQLERDRLLARFNNVRVAQRFAGTPAERQRVEEELQAAESALAKRGPRIREQLATLQAELQKLEQAPHAPRQRLKTMDEYTEKLRNDQSLRTPLQELLLRFQHDYRRTFLSGYRDATNEARLLRCDIETLRNYSQDRHGDRFVPGTADGAPDPVYAVCTRRHLDRKDPSSIAAFIAGSERELARLQAMIDRDQPDEDQVLAEIEALRNRYVPTDD